LFKDGGVIIAIEETRPIKVELEEVVEEVPPRDISLKRRILNPRTLVSFGIALTLLYFLVTRVNIDLQQVWTNVRQANPSLYLMALVVYYLSFPARGYRWQRLLRNAEVEEGNIPRVRDLGEIIYLSWFANTLVPAKLGDLYRGYLLKKESGIPFSLSMGTVVAERVLDFVVLVMLMGTAGLISYRGHLPPQVVQLLGITFGIVVVVLLGLLFLQRFGAAVGRLLPGRIAQLYTTFSGAMLLSFGRLPELLGYTVVAWACESARVLFVTLALGVSLPLSMVVFMGLLAALLTTLPLTPGGLGFAEAGLTVALVLYGMDREMAATVTALDRTISYLSLVVGGFVVYLVSKKTK
jgi:hypothetical protein